MAWACGEVASPTAKHVSLSIVPVFDANGALASNADRLRIRILRDSASTIVTVKDTTVAAACALRQGGLLQAAKEPVRAEGKVGSPTP